MEIEETLTAVEKQFNIFGSIPIVGCISGALRAIAGKIQFAAGIIIGAIGLILHVFNKDHQKLFPTGAGHAIHGALNLLRGTVECILGVTLLGSFALLLIQALSTNGFEPTVKYPSMQNKSFRKLNLNF